MSALPLQPDLRPRSRHPAVLLGALAMIAIAAIFGYLQSGRPSPPRLLLSQNDAPIPANGYAPTVQRLIDRAERRVWVMMYVMRPDDEPVTGLVRALAAARGRGLDVGVVLDRSYRWGSDEVEGKYRDAAAWLGERGVPVLVDDLATRTHAKVVLIDDELAVVGSHNWTRSALMRNHETSFLTRDPELVRQLERVFRLVPGWPPAGSRTTTDD